jgi:hypothetical protein
MSEERREKTSTRFAVENGDLEFEPPLVEITTCIRDDQEFALKLIENAERRRLGAEFDSASLIQEALDLLIEKKLVVVRLGKRTWGNPGSRGPLLG